jgi:hypothetical protein
LFPSSVGIFASIKNLILQERDVHVFIDIATARTILLRWLEKDTVFYPSPTPKRQGKYRVLTIDGKCECGSDQGFSRGVALSTCNHVDTKKAQPEMSRLQQRILHKLDRRAKDLPIDII